MARSLFEGHRLDPATLNIEIEREADFFKRFGTKHLASATWSFYSQDWIILLNETANAVHNERQSCSLCSKFKTARKDSTDFAVTLSVREDRFVDR